MGLVIDVHEDSKIVEIWLDHRDQNDLQLSAKLRPLFADYNGKKYTVAVFQSGKEDLYEQTRQLLLHNRDYFAGLESKQSQGATLSPEDPFLRILLSHTDTVSCCVSRTQVVQYHLLLSPICELSLIDFLRRKSISL